MLTIYVYSTHMDVQGDIFLDKKNYPIDCAVCMLCANIVCRQYIVHICVWGKPQQ